jgi:5'-nucleotidase
VLLLAAAAATVTILGFSDYHSHAVPFYAEGRPGQAGIARAVGFLRKAKADPRTLVFSGGDMLNAGTPAWSEEYRCVEWPWLNGLVDAMALGNHDLDYGAAELDRCRKSAGFPVLSANLLQADGTSYLEAGGKPYFVRDVGGIKVAAFAVGGPDVQHLVKKDVLPPGTRWADAMQSARSIVKQLREVEHADVIVLIGHQTTEEDEALARAVPGIDLVLGSHSHHKGELRRIDGTRTWIVSPAQYLTYVSRVEVRVEQGRVTHVTGGLVRMEDSVAPDPLLALEVAAKQRALEAKRPDRFRSVGRAAVDLSDDGVFDGESVLSNWATDAVRARAGTHVFFTTASSFRATLPAGDVVAETLFMAVPYKNAVMTGRLAGAQLLEWLAVSAARRGSDGFSPASGVRYAIGPAGVRDVEVLRDPAHPEAGFAALDPAATYRVATSDYQAFVADGYKQVFAQAASIEKTTLEVQQVLLDALAAGEARARLDGRVRVSH